MVWNSVESRNESILTTTNAKPKRVDYNTSSIGFALPLKFFRSDLNFPSKLKTTTLMEMNVKSVAD